MESKLNPAKLLSCLLLIFSSLLSNFAISQAKSSTKPVANYVLPPDPGEAGKMTLNGIDSNNNGVRDDIEIAIYKRHPNDKGKRYALMQKAKAMQKMLDAGENGDLKEALQLAKTSDRASDCIYEKNGGFDNTSSQEAYGFIEVLLVNTDLRADAYDKYNSLFDGQAFDYVAYPNPCDK